MQSPLTHPSSVKLLGEVCAILANKQVFSRPANKIVFVCGGSNASVTASIRARFLNYATRNLKQYRFLLAEVASQDLVESSENPEFLNLTEFETLIAEISDCVIIFPESPGSYAELGCFSVSKEIAKKTLVVSRSDLQEESFINNGPIDQINRATAFKFVLLPGKSENGFKFIKQRLLAKLSYKSGKRVELVSGTPQSLKEVLYLCYELVRIFRLLTVQDIVIGVEKALGTADEKNCRRVISILYASKFLVRSSVDSSYFSVRDESVSFLDIRNVDVRSLIAKSTAILQKDLSHLVSILDGGFE